MLHITGLQKNILVFRRSVFFYMAGATGIEPVSERIKIFCLNRLATPQKKEMVVRTGFEPVYVTVKG